MFVLLPMTMFQVKGGDGGESGGGGGGGGRTMITAQGTYAFEGTYLLSGGSSTAAWAGGAGLCFIAKTLNGLPYKQV